MKLVTPNEQHILTMMEWFPDQPSLMIWSGPNFRYPYTYSSFIADLKMDELQSFSLVDEAGNFKGFGQFYLRMDKCHLGRIIVAPNSRGQKIGTELITQLSILGCQTLAVDTISLFVLVNNDSAFKLYQSFGFEIEDYPEKITLENCLYMVKKHGK
ncbi:MAG: GNAT family N-acetyltransferase [Alteromonadaceae bacterium]|nr:GNAT family N-acetyltransferase [Alteromonadaceae bacterium]